MSEDFAAFGGTARLGGKSRAAFGALRTPLPPRGNGGRRKPRETERRKTAGKKERAARFAVPALGVRSADVARFPRF